MHSEIFHNEFRSAAGEESFAKVASKFVNYNKCIILTTVMRFLRKGLSNFSGNCQSRYRIARGRPSSSNRFKIIIGNFGMLDIVSALIYYLPVARSSIDMLVGRELNNNCHVNHFHRVPLNVGNCA